MGRAYSVNGFLNAVLRRSSKTILVEGPADKNVLHRMALEKYPERADSGVIDHAGILSDEVLKGFGNRARVLYAQTCADQLSASVPKISAVLGTLTDREWDGVSFTAYTPDPEWQAPAQTAGRFLTQGHSIENYSLDVVCAKEYVKYSFAEFIDAHVLAAIDERFPAILVLATVLSLKIRNDACLGKSAGIIDIPHLLYEDGRYHLDAGFSVSCKQRQFFSAATIVTQVNQGIDTAWERLRAHVALKWLPHGHLGEEIVWVGVAHTVLDAGVSREVADEIAHGRKKDRERFKAQWLSGTEPGRRIPLDMTVHWLYSGSL